MQATAKAIAEKEHRDFTALLVPAEIAAQKPAKSKRETLTTTVDVDVAAQFRDAASRASTNVSALIAALITGYVATA
jgi:hypothetical protein